ncbi:hypothetical protein MKW92_027106 [Papaver armeniacum]|nr:hypothetical protein MKW92_027106 [Papaver armeniacum]
MPWDGNEVIVSSDSSDGWESDTDVKEVSSDVKPAVIPAAVIELDKELTPQDIITRRAEMYQEYMKQIPVPSLHGSAVPFNTWQELARSLKLLYKQPLHYLTNICLKQWDKARIGTNNEYLPLDGVIHPRKAEATIWLMEEVHRLASSHHHLANLWLLDPMHQAFVDPVFKQI